MTKEPRPAHGSNRLGRGLSSLIASSTLASAGEADGGEVPTAPPLEPGHRDEGLVEPGRPLEVPIDRIAPNPYQPRKDFDATELAELAASIAQQGLLQPVLVSPAPQPTDGRLYVLIAGERRLRAARQAGLSSIPCILREATDRQLLEWSLIENIQRADLNPIERAGAYRAYMDRFALTQSEVADRTGESRANVSNYLRILELPGSVQAMLLDGRLTFGHARALAALAGREPRQAALAERVARQGLSVRQMEQLVAAEQQAVGSPPAARASRAKPPYVADLEARLTRAAGTRVTILPGRAKNTGRIVIDYYSLDDFDRLATSLGLGPEE